MLIKFRNPARSRYGKGAVTVSTEDHTGFEGFSRIFRKRMGKAISDFDLIQEGDSILVGLSGGKDSMALVLALREMQIRSPVPFSLQAGTMDISEGKRDLSPIAHFCEKLGVPWTIAPYPILDIIEKRQERSPCSLCANIRRGLLCNMARERGCKILALGHNLDDVVETVLLNMFHTGRFTCFRPKAWLSRSEVWIIRPFVYIEESHIRSEVSRIGIPVVDNICPFDDQTQRQHVKDLVAQLRGEIPAIKQNILRSLSRWTPSDRWNIMDPQESRKK